ncbi:MAG: hypothetical protein SGJ00_11335 [bacterium]|nr:hypothetical protein [bacterium]
MKTPNLKITIARHYRALAVAEQKLYIFKTIKVAFAWDSLNRNDPEGFFQKILLYLKEIRISNALPQDLKDWAERLLVSYQNEYSIFNQTKINKQL